MSRKLFGVCLFCITVIFLSLATSVFALDWQLVDDGDPAPRGRYGMAYDSLRGKVILFGGDVGLLGTAADTWEYDGSTWEKRMTPSQPTVTSGSGSIQGMVYDSERNRVVLLVYESPALRTWEYDGTDWTQIITQNSPSLALKSMAYDRWRKKTVLYHGRPNSTWEYDGTDWSEVQTANNPGDRSGYKMVFDSTRNRVLLFGGWLYTGDFASDLWAYDGNDWTPVAAQNTPPPRGAFGLAYNESDDKIILYGGYQLCGDGSCLVRDTWQFDGAAWSEVTTSNAPSARHVSDIIYDAQKHRVVLFGGLRSENWGGGCDTLIYFDDTWEFDGTNWVEMATRSSPAARRYPGVTYDSERNVTLMFGGKNIDMGCPLNDTWTYDGTWQEIQLDNPPPPIVSPLLTYDSNRRRAIMVGMWRYEPGGHCCDDQYIEGTTTWEFDGTEWIMVNTPTPAPNLLGTPISFDSVRNKVVAITSTYPAYDVEVWEYDGTDWTQIVTLHLPTPRSSFSSAFDKVRGKTVLFGGVDYTNNPYTYLHDTWEYDGTDWTQVETAYSPETAVQGLMTFDSSRAMILLYGGYVLGQTFHDTWTYNGSNWQKIETGVSPSIVDGTQIVFDENRTRTVLFGGIDSFSVISGETWELYEEPAARWAMTYGGSGNDKAQSVRRTSDGGYVVSGYTDSFGTMGHAWVLKLNADGTAAWENTYGGPASQGAVCIDQTFDQGSPDGYIVAGGPGTPNADFGVLRLNLDGTKAWQKLYGGDYEDTAYSIYPTNDGGYVVSGYTDSFANPDEGHGWILKLNADSTIAWEYSYGGPAGQGARCIQEVLDQGSPDGYIVANGPSGPASVYGEIGVLRLNSDGAKVWQKLYSTGNGAGHAKSIGRTSDDGYIVAGTTDFQTGSDDVWVFKLNPNGTVLWSKTYGGSGVDTAYAIQATTDGGCVVAGSTTSFGAGNEDFWLLKLYADDLPNPGDHGVVEWQKTYGGSDVDIAYSVDQTCDGYVVAGSTTSFGAGNEDAWVLKLDSNGEIPGCSVMGTSTATIADAPLVVTDITWWNPYETSATIAGVGWLPEGTLGDTSIVCYSEGPEILLVDGFEGYTNNETLRVNWKGGKDARKPFLEPQSTGETGPDGSQCMRVSLKWTKSPKGFGLVNRKYDPYIDLTGMNAFHFYVKVARKIRIQKLKVELKKYPEGTWSSAKAGRSELESGVWKEIWLPRTSFTDTSWGLISVIQLRIVERDPSSDHMTKVYFDDIYFSPTVP